MIISKNNIKRKIEHLEKNIKYYERVYPKIRKINDLKKELIKYKNLLNNK